MGGGISSIIAHDKVADSENASSPQSILSNDFFQNRPSTLQKNHLLESFHYEFKPKLVPLYEGVSHATIVGEGRDEPSMEAKEPTDNNSSNGRKESPDKSISRKYQGMNKLPLYARLVAYSLYLLKFRID